MTGLFPLLDFDPRQQDDAADFPGKDERNAMPGPGSTANVIAALSSFFLPGLGQLLQGRVGMALLHCVLASVLWFVWLGWIIHIWSTLDAATFAPRLEPRL